MPRAYDSEFPYEVLLAWSGTSLREAIKSPLFWLAQAMYVVAVVVVRVTGLRALNASKIVGAMNLPAGLLGSLFVFQLVWYNGNNYSRFNAHWTAAMKGWSRLNDLALQVNSYVQDLGARCEILRFMHAANHFVYMDFSGQQSMPLIVDRRLLTEDEHARILAKLAGIAATAAEATVGIKGWNSFRYPIVRSTLRTRV